MTCSLVAQIQSKREGMHETQAPISFDQVNPLDLRKYCSNELPVHMILLADDTSGHASPNTFYAAVGRRSLAYKYGEVHIIVTPAP